MIQKIKELLSPMKNIKERRELFRRARDNNRKEKAREKILKGLLEEIKHYSKGLINEYNLANNLKILEMYPDPLHFASHYDGMLRNLEESKISIHRVEEFLRAYKKVSEEGFITTAFGTRLLVK